MNGVEVGVGGGTIAVVDELEPPVDAVVQAESVMTLTHTLIIARR
jgi:hypothetical protein